MSDQVLIDGDEAQFIPAFAPAVVMVQPGSIKGSGPATLGGKKVCVDGDEGSVEVSGCSYVTPQYCIPGSGTLKIDRLGSDQKAQHTSCKGTLVLLLGTFFDAVFEVQSPAKQPPPGPGSPIPDATTKYMGKGRFMTKNTKLKGA